MAVVVDFIYGRPLTPAESQLAGTRKIANAHKIEPGAILGDNVTRQLEEYYQPHTQRLLQYVLLMLRTQGLQVHGFDSAPWVSS